MNLPFCLPVIKSNKAAILKTIKANIRSYPYFELWLDYVKDLDREFILELVKLLGNRVIFVFRRQKLEKIHMSFNTMVELISIIKDSPSLLDLDISTQNEEIKYIQKHLLKVKTVVSYHNYQETPSTEKLEEIVKTIKMFRPYILKISTMCKSHRDALRLLQLLIELKEDNQRCIILGMGKFGIITRIYGALWGNELIFAPRTLAEQSAEGQLTRDQLHDIINKLK